MPDYYGPEPLRPLNVTMRHGFEEQYLSEQLLESMADDFLFYFDDKRHRTSGNPTPEEVKSEDAEHYYQPIQDWKIIKDRQKTVSAALLLCLNLGVDPPDVIKTHPSARVEAWVDPLSFQDSKKAIEQIGKNLQAQYETLSLRTRYKQSLDPCVEDVKRFCNSLRRQSKDDRILFHYNGHGVPQPTPSGEIWVFNRGYTQYIPVSLYDLQTWLGAPCVFVYDCSSAGNIVANFQKFVEKRIRDEEAGNPDNAAPSPSSAYKQCFQLASCRADELLLMSPELPADLFTCCLTCPIEISIKVFLMQSELKDTKYRIFFETPTYGSGAKQTSKKSSFRSNIPAVNIPGILSDRRTPLGELNWIFTAITDTIAWTSLPRPLFKKLFRHDLMIAALFRNFLLAKRIMPWYNCHPISDPELPDSVATHPMWDVWDLAMDEVLGKLVEDLKHNESSQNLESQLILQQQESLANQTQKNPQSNSNDHRPESIRTESRFTTGNLSTMSLANHPALNTITRKTQAAALNLTRPANQQQYTGFFEQNLTAFELWLKYSSNVRNPPEQLPIVLQVLLSQVHRIRALVLLSRFLDLGPWAVYLSLSIGIFPYVLKLLQSPAQELKPILVFIWARIMSIDYKNTQADLIKEKGYMYFVSILAPDWRVSPSITAGPSFSNGGISMSTMPVMNGSRTQLYDQQNTRSQVYQSQLHTSSTTDEQKAMAAFVLASFIQDFKSGQMHCFSVELLNKLSYYILNSDVPLLRQWSILLIGLLYNENPLHKSICMTTGVMDTLVKAIKDPVPEVRTATVLALKYFISGFDDAEIIIGLQQGLEQQYQQLHTQLQYIHNNIHSQQSQTPQQHQQLEQQQSKLEQQMHHCQIRQSQLENVDLKKIKQQEIVNLIACLPLRNDGSPLVRKELAIMFSQIVYRYCNFFIVVVFQELLDEIAQSKGATFDSEEFRGKNSFTKGSVFSIIWKGLLILSADPFTEISKIAEKVIDYILLELSVHKDLGEAFSKIEAYLSARSSSLNQSGKLNFGNSQIQIVKKPIGPMNGKATIPNETIKSTKVSGISKETNGGLFSLLTNFRQRKDETGEEDENKGNILSGMSYINTPKVSLPTARAPRSHVGNSTKFPVESTFLEYSREYFQEPQMRKPEAEEAGSEAYIAKLWRQKRNEGIIEETQKQKKLSLYGDWSNRIRSYDTKSQVKLLKFAQFENYLVSSDDRDAITVYDWDENKTLARFSNGNPFGTKVTDIKLMNEDDIPLLMVGSSDGLIKIYKNLHSVNDLQLVTAWRGLSDMLLTPRSNGLLSEWQQSRGSLLVTGDVKIIRVWDALSESLEVDIPAKTSSLFTSLTSDQVAGNIFVAGFSDGTIRVYDRRTDPRLAMVRRWRGGGGKPGAWINNVHMQRGGYRELVSGSTNGVVELWDIRHDQPVATYVDENKKDGKRDSTTMVSVQVHEHAPIFATGTKSIKLWTTSGDILSSFRNSKPIGGIGAASTFAATGIRNTLSNTSSTSAFLSQLAFHPHRMMLAAANSHDSFVNIYSCEEKRDNIYLPFFK
ncbi:Trp-Asp (WD) repeats profile [Nakaseomyces glabratus]|nr:Trp-Asp (WD) repeats profile [Nakaseomyces glabratus]KAH7593052.1 Trp-Asp (WD) repeats profile [Nakaseomyces glabratus]KAH7610896.1 Trp-Asp (WD) repeats profile [Nakaseomyces glabratus]